MKIRTKIMLGFLILAVMLAVAGAISIYELRAVGSSVQGLLDDNYRSIEAAKKMTEALERQDSGILLLLSGKWKEGRQTIRTADQKFLQALATAESNLTIPGEKEYVDRIKDAYLQYSRLWDQPIAGTSHEGTLEWYFAEAHKAFNNTKTSVQELMAINDNAISLQKRDFLSGRGKFPIPDPQNPADYIGGICGLNRGRNIVPFDCGNGFV